MRRQKQDNLPGMVASQSDSITAMEKTVIDTEAKVMAGALNAVEANREKFRYTSLRWAGSGFVTAGIASAVIACWRRNRTN